MNPAVLRVDPPPGLIADWYGGADLLDSYAVTLPAGMPQDVAALAAMMFARWPLWVKALLRLRDLIMGRLGVKTTAAIHKAGARDGRARIGFFPVMGRSADEIVLGEDDRHLDFRASVLVRAGEAAGSRQPVVTTAVRCHNLLGRIYLRTIQPFHVLIVRSNLAGLASRPAG